MRQAHQELLLSPTGHEYPSLAQMSNIHLRTGVSGAYCSRQQGRRWSSLSALGSGLGRHMPQQDSGCTICRIIIVVRSAAIQPRVSTMSRPPRSTVPNIPFPFSPQQPAGHRQARAAQGVGRGVGGGVPPRAALEQPRPPGGAVRRPHRARGGEARRIHACFGCRRAWALVGLLGVGGGRVLKAGRLAFEQVGRDYLAGVERCEIPFAAYLQYLRLSQEEGGGRGPALRTSRSIRFSTRSPSCRRT
jgi:hypothetical protein